MIDLDVIRQVLEQQGLVGLLLLYSILQQQKAYNKCVEQKYKLTEFIMQCMKDEEDHDRKMELATLLNGDAPDELKRILADTNSKGA
jgi:hypothetical protein